MPSYLTYVKCLACVFKIYNIAPCAYAFEEKPIVSFLKNVQIC